MQTANLKHIFSLHNCWWLDEYFQPFPILSQIDFRGFFCFSPSFLRHMNRKSSKNVSYPRLCCNLVSLCFRSAIILSKSSHLEREIFQNRGTNHFLIFFSIFFVHKEGTEEPFGPCFLFTALQGSITSDSFYPFTNLPVVSWRILIFCQIISAFLLFQC